MMANQTKPTNKPNKMSTETTKIAPINPNSKLYVDGVESSVTFGEYKTTKAKETGLSEGVIMKIAMAAKAKVDYDTSEFEGTKAQKKALTAAITEIKADFAAHAKNKVIVEKNEADAIIKRKEEREAEAKAKEADKTESAEMLEASLNNKALVKATTQLTENAETSMKKVLGEKFSIAEDGSITITEGEELTKADFANTFATLVSVAHTSDTIADRSAKYEAQVASLAKEKLGTTWVNLFSAAPADLSRIQKGVKAFETCKVIGKKAIRLFNKLPLSTTRALLELKVTTKEDQGGDQEAADKKNLEAKTEVINLASAHLKEHGALSQTDAKNLKSKYKDSLGLKGKVKMGFFYIFLIGDAMHVCGSEKRDENLLAAATLCIDSNGNKNTLTKDSIVLDPLSPPSEEILAKVAKVKAAMDAAAEAAKPAPKAAGKAKAKAAPAADELEEEEEEEEEEAPAKPAAKAKPAAPAVEEEEEEEEEEENDADDADDDGDDD